MTRPLGSPNRDTAAMLDKLHQFIAAHPGATRLQCADHLGLKSSSNSHRYVKMLEEQGRVTILRGIVTAKESEQ